MQDLSIANDLLESGHEALWQRFERDGYLFFRDVLDKDAIARARKDVGGWFEREGLAEVKADRVVFIGHDMSALPSQPLPLHDQGTWQRLAADPSLQALLTLVFGDKPFILPLGEYQFSWPGKSPGGIHQDEVFNIGLGLVVCWIPLVDVPAEVGGLRIAEAMHSHGSFHKSVKQRVGAGAASSYAKKSDIAASTYIDPSAIPADAWRRIDYRQGDLLLFDGYTPHQGLPTTTDSMRLSVDMRVVPPSRGVPAVGHVLEADEDHLAVETEDGVVTVKVDEETMARFGYYSVDRVPMSSFLDREAVVAHHDGRASFVRLPFPHG